MSFFRRFERNTAGRDFVVGDIHGCFDKLRAAMKRVNFDEATDRLFSVGDLVDRGPSSHEAVEWLERPWFNAVRGNHEQMIVDWTRGQCDKGIHLANGALWFYGLSPEQQRATADAFACMPYAIEVDTPDGTFGLVHAEVPGDDWMFLRHWLENPDQLLPGQFDHVERFLLWARDIIRGRSKFAGVEGIDRVYVGHTPVKDWAIVGNVHYIDTGIVYDRKLTLVCMTDGSVMQEAA